MAVVDFTILSVVAPLVAPVGSLTLHTSAVDDPKPKVSRAGAGLFSLLEHVWMTLEALVKEDSLSTSVWLGW